MPIREIKKGWAGGNMLVCPALRRQTREDRKFEARQAQEDPKFKASLG